MLLASERKRVEIGCQNDHSAQQQGAFQQPQSLRLLYFTHVGIGNMTPCFTMQSAYNF